MSNVKFHNFHRPALESGEYRIEVSESVQVTKSGNNVPETKLGSTSKSFFVGGERYILNPQDVQAVFPPRGSFGDYSNTLPHIVLNRSTLPWERHSKTITTGGKNTPWLALLVFNHPAEGNTASGANTLPDLKQVQWKRTIGGTDYFLLTDAEGASVAAATASTLPVNPYNLKDELGDHPSDLVNVIDVPKSLLNTILPTANDTNFLAHTRTYRDGTQDKEVAVVLSNRLPESGRVSEIHLVSLEGFYDVAQGQTMTNFAKAASDATIRLISLYHWSFESASTNDTFPERLNNLHTSPFRLPDRADVPANTNNRLKEGKILLPHNLRDGSNLVSWYRGPLVPVNITATNTPPTPVNASDYLLQFDNDFAILDTTYAAAWELGRQLMLENKALSVQLYNWRRSMRQTTKRIEQQQDDMPFTQSTAASVTLPNEVSNWLRSLTELRNIPFNYLVPKETLLPEESIRFFKLDPLWITRLLDGALSIGRSLTHYHTMDSNNWTTLINAIYPRRQSNVQGFLLRSGIVSSRFHFCIQAFNKRVLNTAESGADANLMTQLRLERLSDDIMLGLFYYDTVTNAGNTDGTDLKTLDIYTKPEMLHFGFIGGTQTDGTQNNFTNLRKQFRNTTTGQLVADSFGSLTNISKGDAAYRTVNVAEGANSLSELIESNVAAYANIVSSQFAFQMIEGVEKVRFSVPDMMTNNNL
ncbi:MAG TPA: hypothetical protein DCS93_19440 [Microscillaceae bacterium]|nr:hypothetical protein [Microscillaceae bacterium]